MSNQNSFSACHTSTAVGEYKLLFRRNFIIHLFTIERLSDTISVIVCSSSTFMIGHIVTTIYSTHQQTVSHTPKPSVPLPNCEYKTYLINHICL